jgi:hypothetical protein
MKYLAVLVLIGLSLAPVAGMAESSIRLRVSVTIPPKPCLYPRRCDAATSKTVPAAVTRVLVNQGKVRYVGSPPTIEKDDDLLVVKF